MAYTPPNVFANGTSLNAGLVQANNDAMKTYIDGGAVSGDVSTATWVRAPHIMRGTYIPLNNTHEFTTGFSRGSGPDYQPNNITMSADRYRTPFPANLSPANENIAIDYVLDDNSWDERLGWQVFPKHPPLTTTPTTTIQQLTETKLTTFYKTFTCQENDAGGYRNVVATFEQGIPGFYRRRAIQNWQYETITGVTPGTRNQRQWYVGSNNIVNDFADFGYALEVYYK